MGGVDAYDVRPAKGYEYPANITNYLLSPQVTYASFLMTYEWGTDTDSDPRSALKLSGRV